MRIIETFLSIQGEGPRSGVPCFFIRTAGCNLNCSWCDTRYALDDDGREMSIQDLVALFLEAASAPVFTGSGHVLPVTVTGGEPLLQPDLPDLLDALMDLGASVEVMTNGTLPLTGIPAPVNVVVDLKVDFLMEGRMPAALQYFEGDAPAARPNPGDAVKFVVRDHDDFIFAAGWADRNGVFDRIPNVFAAPAWGMVDPRSLADWVLREEPRFRLGLQLHKYIWGPETRL